MKKQLLLLLGLLGITILNQAQTTVFYDDFESGAGNWDVDGYWGTTDEYAFGGDYSFTESPYSDLYVAGEVQTATLNSSIDLSTALDANVTFYALIDLEAGFDYTYLDASSDGGDTWVNIAVFNGEGMLDEWMAFDFSLGAFVGSDDVKLRFRFVPDFFVEFDGMYIDDFTVIASTTDASPPLILHDVLNLYEGTLYENDLTATLLDASGISNTELWYSADGASFVSVDGVNIGGDEYSYTIPALDPGTWVDYYFTATDASDDLNTISSDEYSIIAGNYIGYDNGVIDFVQDIGEASASGYESAAVRITLDSFTTVVAVVIQNYTDYTRPNDSLEIHIWADDAGLPGADLIEPFMVFPEATLDFPNQGTRVDLRPYADDLEGLIGDIYIGYTSPDGTAWVSQTTPGIAGRTLVSFGATWFELTDDYHFRAITGPYSGAPNADFTFDASGDPVVDFTDLTSNYPDAWSWDFGDGIGTSTLQNPTYYYTENGDYEVCLTASNVLGSSTHCETVTISSFLPPTALFSFDDSGDPVVEFTDLSVNLPTSWSWTFGDGGISLDQNPTHTFATNGEFTVCLTASNAAGSSESCQNVSIDGNIVAPSADFAYSGAGLSLNFTDLSTNSPTFWGWDFGDGTSSFDQNPSHTFASSTTYEVCLTAGNIAGTDEECKQISLGTSVEDLLAAGVGLSPNPASEYVVVSLSGWGNDATLLIYDVQGRLVLEQQLLNTVNTINISALPAATYQVVINSKEKMASGRLMID
jgi:PKD repeat protein